ncbi:MAG: hypothetical protein JRD93_14945 [Deltaproteobacteria bacterium]|nr:hypothetical protein [Deltaproteobacteria bacterium]
MYAKVENPKENKSRAVANSVAQKKNEEKTNTRFVDNRSEVKVQNSLQLMMQKIIQRNGVPSTDERTKSAQVGDRHDPPHPYMDLGGWYKTLMSGRISDLYLTALGFPGHAQQIQQELGHLKELIDDKMFKDQSMVTAREYETSIKNFIIEGAKNIGFDIEKFIFRFSGASTLSIERRDNRLYVNGR